MRSVVSRHQQQLQRPAVAATAASSPRLLTRSHECSIDRLSAVAAEGPQRFRSVLWRHWQQQLHRSKLVLWLQLHQLQRSGGVSVDPAAVAAIQEHSVVLAAAVAAIQEQSVALAAAVTDII